MIERYSTKEMSAVWSSEKRYEIWLHVEILALEKMVELGLVPADALAEIKERATYTVDRVEQIEKEVKHDVIAFLTAVAEKVGESSRYVHRGMTSNDLLDTTLAVQMKMSCELIFEELDSLLETLREKALRYKDVPTIGRSHGIHAEPTTFGLKILSWYCELKRRKEDLLAACKNVTVGKLSGAVGTYQSLEPAIERYVHDKLVISSEDVATQVVARDRHAEFFSSLALLGASIERWCVEIRHLQRTEVAEVYEPFAKGQKGSSAMPHKKNPILTENMTGLARLLRGYAVTAFENVALWHERDISHSSVERVIAPDATNLTHFMLKRFKSVVKGLVVDTDRMLRNLNTTLGLYSSGTLLIALVDAGLTREDAYAVVQKIAHDSWEKQEEFAKNVMQNEEITNALTKEKLMECFELSHHLRFVDAIFNKVLKEDEHHAV